MTFFTRDTQVIRVWIFVHHFEFPLKTADRAARHTAARHTYTQGVSFLFLFLSKMELRTYFLYFHTFSYTVCQNLTNSQSLDCLWHHMYLKELWRHAWFAILFYSLNFSLHQLNSKHNGPVSFFKTIYRHFLKPFPAVWRGSRWLGWIWIEPLKVWPTFSSFSAKSAKMAKKYYGLCSLIEFVLYRIHNSKGTFCVWVKALIINEWSSEFHDLRQQHRRNIAPSTQLILRKYSATISHSLFYNIANNSPNQVPCYIFPVSTVMTSINYSSSCCELSNPP